MSNFETKPQLPTEETVKVRDGVPMKKGYTSGRSGGLFADVTYSGLPASGSMNDGTLIFVTSGAIANAYLADAAVAGGFRQIIV